MPDSKPPSDDLDDIAILRDRVEKLEKLWAKFEGAGILIKVLFWIVGPLYGLYQILKDHWKP